MFIQHLRTSSKASPLCGLLQIMWDNGHRAVPFIIVAFYAFSHYCMAVVMFKELDLREAGGTYFADVITFLGRILDVLFFDIQLCASVVHSNRMLEGMTQLMFKGYEEARVALTTLLFTIPCCILIGVEYGVFMNGRLVQVRGYECLHHSSHNGYASARAVIVGVEL